MSEYPPGEEPLARCDILDLHERLNLSDARLEACYQMLCQTQAVAEDLCQLVGELLVKQGEDPASLAEGHNRRTAARREQLYTLGRNLRADAADRSRVGRRRLEEEGT